MVVGGNNCGGGGEGLGFSDGWWGWISNAYMAGAWPWDDISKGGHGDDDVRYGAVLALMVVASASIAVADILALVSTAVSMSINKVVAVMVERDEKKKKRYVKSKMIQFNLLSFLGSPLNRNVGNPHTVEGITFLRNRER